mmetsp:Transcript_12903/g.35014  ORF Transcript_12903/g.35014 Transcript_12903/m.35014 type:complete len:343 (+) Transcript_12903:208-1236(+)
MQRPSASACLEAGESSADTSNPVIEFTCKTISQASSLATAHKNEVWSVEDVDHVHQPNSTSDEAHSLRVVRIEHAGAHLLPSHSQRRHGVEGRPNGLLNGRHSASVERRVVQPLCRQGRAGPGKEAGTEAQRVVGHCNASAVKLPLQCGLHRGPQPHAAAHGEALAPEAPDESGPQAFCKLLHAHGLCDSHVYLVHVRDQCVVDDGLEKRPYNSKRKHRRGSRWQIIVHAQLHLAHDAVLRELETSSFWCDLEGHPGPHLRRQLRHPAVRGAHYLGHRGVDQDQADDAAGDAQSWSHLGHPSRVARRPIIRDRDRRGGRGGGGGHGEGPGNGAVGRYWPCRV